MKTTYFLTVLTLVASLVFAGFAQPALAADFQPALQTSRVQIAHFAPFADTIAGTAVDIFVDDTEVLTNFLFGEATDYLSLETGDHLIEIFPAGGTTAVISETVTLAADTDYTVAAVGKDTTTYPLELLTLVDDNIAPATGAKLRLGHLAPFADTLPETLVDVCTDAGVPLVTDVQYLDVTDPYLEPPAGVLDLMIAAPGGTCDTMLLDIPALDLVDGDIVDLFVIGDNMNQELQLATLTGVFLALSQVKVAHFAPFADTLEGTSVSVHIDGEEALTDMVFGEITGYLTFEPGDYFIEIIPTGTMTAAISGTVTIENMLDYTLAAIGNGSLQPLELMPFEDDNTVPDGGANLRVAHLAPVSADLNETLVDVCTADGAPVMGLENLAYKDFTDPYLNLPAGTYDLQLTAAGSNCETVLLELDPITLNEGDVGELYAIGDNINQDLQVATFPEMGPMVVFIPIIANQSTATASP